MYSSEKPSEAITSDMSSCTYLSTESVENPVSEVVLSMSDDIGTSAEYEVESRDKGRERGSSPTDVDPDVGYAPYDSCYMCTYMYTDDLELSGQEPLPYEVTDCTRTPVILLLRVCLCLEYRLFVFCV